MRVLVWNLRSGTDKKWDHLLSFARDIAVLPEVARAPRRLGANLFEPEVAWHWVGANPSKGLAVATFGRPSTPLLVGPTGRWSVGVKVGRLIVLGIWSCPTSPSAKGYSLEIERALNSHRRWLRGASLVVAGDFNAGPSLSGGGAFASVQRTLSSFGLVSAYHQVTEEIPGGERRATYFHHGHEDKPFHIDYCYVSADLVPRLRGVEVGDHAGWVASGVSDHVPLLVEWADEAGEASPAPT